MDEERNLLDYAYVLVKWRRLITTSVLVVSLVTAGISLVLPKEWTARTVVMPPQEDEGPFDLAALRSSALPASLSGLVGGKASAELLKTLLETQRVMGAIVDRFGLVEEYGAPHRQAAIEVLGEHVWTELDREGVLVIEVTAADPGQAAELANSLVGELDAFNRQLKSRRARELREFLESRKELLRTELEQSSRALQRFQEEHGLVDLETQSAALVEVVKHLVQELALLEVELGVVSHQVSAEHEARRLLELQAEELRRQLRERVGGLNQEPGDRPLGPPLSRLPELGYEYTMLTLDLEIREEIGAYLGARLEEARYREALNTPTLQVLDVAAAPRARSAPRRTLMVLIAACVSLGASTVLAFALESLAQLGARNQDKIEAIRQLRR